MALPSYPPPAAAAAGKACDLAEFVFQQLQKKVGIVTAVVEVRRWGGGCRGAGSPRLHAEWATRHPRKPPHPPTHPPTAATPTRPLCQSGYNFLFGLWRYQWDADCELFLRILLVRRRRRAGAQGRAPHPNAPLLSHTSPPVHSPLPHPTPPHPPAQGEVKEDVYVAQARLQEELEDLFAAMDRAKGQATGRIAKVGGAAAGLHRRWRRWQRRRLVAGSALLHRRAG